MEIVLVSPFLFGAERRVDASVPVVSRCHILPKSPTCAPVRHACEPVIFQKYFCIAVMSSANANKGLPGAG
jgi:hypothetical protein